MEIIYNLLFLVIGAGVGVFTTYLWAHFRYENKEKIDKCFKERNQLKQENESLKHKVKELEKMIKELKKELESAYREINEKNKYLSEDKVVIERLGEVKQLADKISQILIDYDKETIKYLLEHYQKSCEKKDNEEDEKEKLNGKSGFF